MGFDGYFPKFTLSNNKTDERRGDGFGMICSGKTMLVDGFQGGEPTRRLITWFNNAGYAVIDIVLLTHWHWDHYNGLLEMLDSGKLTFKIVYCIDPLTYKHGVDGSENGDSVQSDMNTAYKVIRKFQAAGARVLFVSHGDIIKFADITWDIFRKQPTKFTEYDDGNAYAFINDGSLVSYSPELQGMLPGDGPCDQKDAIAYFQKKYGAQKIFVWTDVTHHGGAFSRSNAEAFKNAGGIFACQSCIEKDGPGTTDWTLYGTRRLIQQGVTVWQQDEDIFFTAGAGKLTIRQGSKVITAAIPYQGVSEAGWVHNAKGWWYKKSDGSYCVGWAKLKWSKGENWFFFDDNGYMVTGWRKCKWSRGEDWFYFDATSGAMVTGWQTLKWSKGTDKFFFDANGAMKTGWLKANDKWYYFDPTSGAMATGWITYKTRKCYLDPGTGRALQNETVTINGVAYSFDVNCYLIEDDDRTELDGCDIASYQASIEPSKMSTTDFFIVKATQGTWYINPYFETQYKKAKEAGKLLGLYHYAEGKDATAEARYFVNTIGDKVNEAILALDWEGTSNSTFNTSDEVDWVNEFVKEVYRLTKKWVYFYCSKSVLRRRDWKNVKDAGVKLWDAQYASQNNTDYQKEPWTDDKGFGAWEKDTIRQYSSKGRVIGYDANLDLDKAYMTKTQWKTEAISGEAVSAPAKKPTTEWSEYVTQTTSPVLISNSGSDEDGNYSGGKAGDQSGKEWYIRNWYSRPWNCVLRHPMSEVRAAIATLAVKAAENDNIGYDQSNRDSYGKALEDAGYDPSKITTAVESDCSKGVIDNTKAVGYILGIAALQNISATYTGNMRSEFAKAGFNVLTGAKYLTSDEYLLAGDILLNDKSHTATVITNGTKSGDETGFSSLPLVKRGSSGSSVVLLQSMLNSISYEGYEELEVDGSFGPKTEAQVILYQKDRGLEADGEVGPITWGQLYEDVY